MIPRFASIGKFRSPFSLTRRDDGCLWRGAAASSARLACCSASCATILSPAQWSHHRRSSTRGKAEPACCDSDQRIVAPRLRQHRSSVSLSGSMMALSSAASPEPRVDNVESRQSSPSSSVVRRDGLSLSKDDEHKEENKRRRLSEVRISEVVDAKHSYRWVDPVISHNATVREAIVSTIEGGLSGMMVLGDDSHVVGLLTSRDLLRIIASGIVEGESNDEVLHKVIKDHMTPISQVIYARPEETIGMCRTIMAKLGIKCLPILAKDGRVAGVITAKDISTFGLTAKERGGKESYLNDVSQRVGLSINTSMADPPPFMKSQLSIEQTPLFVNIGKAMLPHPFKTNDSVGRSQRDIGRSEYSKDPDLSEDAFFCTSVKLPEEKDKEPRTFTYFGVADGVGSWREYGVNPREFSRRLMQECRNVVEEAAAGGPLQDSHKFRTHAIEPAAVMAAAFNRVKQEGIVGSSTACVGLFDGIRHQLHFSNLGDSGIIVLRHIDSDIAGSLKRDRTKSRLERKSDLQVTFVSQQQLRSFNHPYQLGWTGEEIPESESTSFKSARDSCTSSIHLRRGDLVIAATDGLFDNVDVDEICEIALEWEQRHGFVRGGDIVFRERRWAMGNSLTALSAEVVSELAATLCQRARENSLNPEIDSPFAILAKENDIMWSGGMPDDCTVLVMHVVGRDPNDVLDTPGI